MVIVCHILLGCYYMAQNFCAIIACASPQLIGQSSLLPSRENIAYMSVVGYLKFPIDVPCGGITDKLLDNR